MKIFFLALTVDIGVFQGDSTHVSELTSNLRKMGFNIRLVARRSGHQNTWPDPFFHCVSRAPKPANEFRRLLQLMLSMIRGAYYIYHHTRGSDLIYSRDRFSLLLALLPSRLWGVPIVYEVNGITSEQRKMHGGYLLNRLYVWLLERLDKVAFKRAVRIVCVTDAVRDFYRKRFPDFATKCETVHNGVNTTLFQPLPINGEVSELRDRLGFNASDEIITYVGNFSIWQGVECLVKSAPMVMEKNPAVRFMVVGRGPTYEKCEHLAEELGVADRVKFVGHIPYTALKYYINISDVCVAPYTRSTPNCPIKVYEYLACGKPVVCSDIPGIDNFRHSGALVLVEPDNPEALASGLLKALADMNARAAQRELGPKVISGYTWADTAKRVASICEAATKIELGT